MTKEQKLLACVTVGMLMIGAGILIPIIAIMGGHALAPWHKWLFAAGAILVLVGRLFNRYEGPDLRLRRLFRIEVWGAIFFCAAAFFLFYPPSPNSNLRNVITLTLAGAFIQIFTSIMIPIQAKKEAAGEPEPAGKKKKGKKQAR